MIGFLKKAYFFFLDFMQTILLAASIFLVIYIFLFRPFQVSGESMYATFKNKEYVLTSIISLKLETPKRGDVIVFKAPTDIEKDYIKRIIGLPGDTVFIREGFVYVNNAKLDESSYLGPDLRTYGGSFMREEQPVTVPQGEYLVMGDNRPFSSDSREWGFLKKKAILGKSFFVYWPLNVVRKVINPYPASLRE